MLFDNGADLNAANEDGNTALMIAAKNGSSNDKNIKNYLTE